MFPFYRVLLPLFVFFSLTIGLTNAHPTTAQDAVPRFESSACQFTNFFNIEAECGYLIVPEDRSNPESGTIRLHVAIVPTDSDTPQSDPIVFLNGGPGEFSVAYTSTLAEISQLSIDRDLIVFDQRGTGFSEPALNCSNLIFSSYDLIGLDLVVPERNKRTYDALVECHDRYDDEGINLSAYNSQENAADVRDLRIVLGYDEINLFGASYGTHLGFNILRDAPEGIRSAVFTGIVPPQINWIADMPSNINRSLRLVFKTCRQDSQCSTQYPELERVYFDLVNRLNTEPIELSIPNPVTGIGEINVLVRGDDYLRMTFSWLYSPFLIAELPSVIFEGASGDHNRIATWIVASAFGTQYVSMGMHYSVTCSEEIAFVTYDDLVNADSAFPEQANAFDQSHYSDYCAIWNVEPANNTAISPVSTDVPVLLLSGAFDPVTPPSYGDLAVASLDNGYHVVLPYGSHFLLYDSCAEFLTTQFFIAPDTPPDTSCADTMEPLEFY